MHIPFHKYHGAGNDFIMIDNREQLFPISHIFIEHLCDRHFGIGADGLILLENDPEVDFSMRYFNSDGAEASMCGNGGRCITAFAIELGIIKQQAIFTAIDGLHTCSFKDGQYSLLMKDVQSIQPKKEGYFLHTGSPHHVCFMSDINTVDVAAEGKAVRYSSEYAPEGCNVNFVQMCPGYLKVRTYERGVENETLACGTGVTASALVAHIYHGYDSPVKIEAMGGTLYVSFTHGNKGFSNIVLTGPAEKVFDGFINS
jgi:diaminopimelate epimerase